MKGLCINLVKDCDYPPNYGIIFLQKKIIFEEKEHTLDYLVLNGDDNFMLLSQSHFEGNVRSPFTFSKMGLGSPPGLSKTQSAIVGVKTPCIEVFFILLERSWSVDVQGGLTWTNLNICSTSYGRKKGRESNWQFDSRPLKVRNRPDPGACMWNATHRWKALEESYNFVLDFVPIRAWGKKLWTPKVPGVKTGIISGLHFGSPGKKCHSDASVVARCREYYMGEGGGFPRIRVVMSQVSQRLPVVSPNTKSVQNEF